MGLITSPLLLKKVVLFLFALYAGLPDMLLDKISQHPIHLGKSRSLGNTDI